MSVKVVIIKTHFTTHALQIICKYQLLVDCDSVTVSRELYLHKYFRQNAVCFVRYAHIFALLLFFVPVVIQSALNCEFAWCIYSYSPYLLFYKHELTSLNMNKPTSSYSVGLAISSFNLVDISLLIPALVKVIPVKGTHGSFSLGLGQ